MTPSQPDAVERLAALARAGLARYDAWEQHDPGPIGDTDASHREGDLLLSFQSWCLTEVPDILRAILAGVTVGAPSAAEVEWAKAEGMRAYDDSVADGMEPEHAADMAVGVTVGLLYEDREMLRAALRVPPQEGREK